MGRGRSRHQGQRDEPERNPYQQRRYRPEQGSYEADDDDEEDYEYEEPRKKRVRRRRKRSMWPALMGGCALGLLLAVIAAAVVVILAIRSAQGVPMLPGGQGGIIGIGGPQSFTKVDTQTVPLTALTQMQVCDKIGNVSVTVDPNASTASVTTKKIVHVASQADANQEFGRINVEVQPPGSITHSLVCAQPLALPAANGTPSTTGTSANTAPALIVNVTIPNSDGLMHDNTDSVDVNITLPQPLITNSTTPLQTDIESALGNITVNGLNGILTIKGSSGNINATNCALAAGSQLETGQGNIIFNGTLQLPQDPTTQARYTIQSEQGNVDITLPTTTNVILDSNINVGKLNANDFTITPTVDGESANYHGSLNPAAGTQPASVLLIDVSTGNITLHKA